ncbi:hypothetical protein OJF2_04040 [Aquisphaera giovannonii]|uniref:Uncharacterized protein n=1 Tax=Aquisphaera giovannonii TaxID=406548 RepID=A0A5B9VVH9_9BACT|nr:hypothetical protein [Aquisphaera giovannonii]QEH31937.1 hypothetical protein OJF2_04040 [Aquisphaera giovannonii]
MDRLSRRGAIGLGFMSGPASMAALAGAGDAAGPAAPEVSIAVPLYNDERAIAIGPGRRFHVVLANRSERPLRLWSDRCSDGEDNLRFELFEGRGVEVVRRSPRDWDKNFPMAVTLETGDQDVREVSFDPGEWGLPWPQSEIGTRRVRMRAVYEIRATQAAGEKGVWVGKVASRYADYTVRDYRR